MLDWGSLIKQIFENEPRSFPAFRFPDTVSERRKLRFRRIEQLLYFREWAIALRNRTGNPVYFDMILRTFYLLRDLGVVVTDVGVENYRKEFYEK